MGQKVREMDTPEWKEKVQREAIAAVTGHSNPSPRVDLGAPEGYELPAEIIPSVIGSARQNVKSVA